MEIRRKLDRRDNQFKMRLTEHDKNLREQVRLCFKDQEYGFTPSDPDLVRVSWAITLFCCQKWQNGDVAVPPFLLGRKLWDAFSCRAGLDKKHRGPKKKEEPRETEGMVDSMLAQ